MTACQKKARRERRPAARRRDERDARAYRYYADGPSARDRDGDVAAAATSDLRLTPSRDRAVDTSGSAVGFEARSSDFPR